jgi:hypothetical protein
VIGRRMGWPLVIIVDKIEWEKERGRNKLGLLCLMFGDGRRKLARRTNLELSSMEMCRIKRGKKRMEVSGSFKGDHRLIRLTTIPRELN